MSELFSLNSFSVHPARQIDFDVLLEQLHGAKRERSLSYVEGPDDLVLWRYSNRCVYDRMWTPTTVLARGLILDMAERRVVATPFPKFFNLGEDGGGLPEGPFDVFEKLDGSLIIIFNHRGKWRATTRGAFDSSQAQWAQERIAACDLSALDVGTTYLAEAVYPENRIVVRYAEPALVMLSGYASDGRELSFDETKDASGSLGWRAADRYSFGSVSDLMAHLAELPRDQEGYVLRYETGLRVKLKGAEYRRIHALISRVTPLAVWEMLNAGDDMEAIRRELPEEFWDDFDQIKGILGSQFQAIVQRVRDLVATLVDLSDKDVGLRLGTLEADIRSYVFPCRKDGDAFPSGKTREVIWRHIRPTGNDLEGYVPSYAMNRLLDDML